MLKHSTGHMKSKIVGHHILGGKRHLENTGIVPSGYQLETNVKKRVFFALSELNFAESMN